MSTYHFTSSLQGNDGLEAIKPELESLKQNGSIDHWHVTQEGAQKVLAIETQVFTPDKLKHLLREKGFEAQFTLAPGTNKSSWAQLELFIFQCLIEGIVDCVQQSVGGQVGGQFPVHDATQTVL